MSTQNPAPEAHESPSAQTSATPAAESVPATHSAPDPQAAQAAPAPGVQVAQAPGTQVAAGSDGQAPRQISTFLKISIILLAALAIASISLLFIGDFEGKFERVFSTFVAFAVFVGLTAFDTRRGQRNEWYPPVALIANSYILALLLIVVWMTPSGWSLLWDIFWKSLVVILATRAVVGCSQLLLQMAENRPRPLGVFALITSLFATLTGILFTAPIAIDVFDVVIPEMYWRFAVASLLLTALGLSITLLLRWSYGAGDREEARRAREAHRAALAQQRQALPQAAPGAMPAPAGPPALAPSAPPAAPASQAPAVPPAAPVTPAAPVPPGQPQPGPAQPAAQPNAGQPLLPWPTFPDGRPLPVGPDGQPDFSALQR